MELERKVKVAEKKKLQRKARKERLKVCSVIQHQPSVHLQL